jgi:DNA polymerase-1
VTRPRDDSKKDHAEGGPVRLVVIDGANTLYRAFFAIPGLRAPDGTPTNAAYGFVNALIKVLREEHPTHIVVARDPKGGSFRHDLYPEYKAGRDAQPEDLSTQFPLAEQLCEAFGVSSTEVPTFEADDAIATLVDTAPEGTEICIVSTDKDLMQLVRPGVVLLDSMKGRRIDEAAVEERFGVPPAQLLDVRALVGDPSDNIPGVKGIGEKGAAKLIAEWGSLEALLEGAEQVKAKRAREGLLAHADEARLSRELSSLRSDVPLGRDWDSLAVREPDRERLRELYRELGFTRLLETLDAESANEGGGEEAAGAASPAAAEQSSVEILKQASALSALTQALAGSEEIAIQLVASEGNAVDRRLLGIAFSRAATAPVYVQVRGDGLLDREGVGLEALVEML